MRRTVFWFLLCIVFMSPAWSQEDDADAVAEDEQIETTPELDETEDAEDAEEVDEAVVDDEFYQDVDDQDFRPSEDVPADQSIPLPSDI